MQHTVFWTIYTDRETLFPHNFGYFHLFPTTVCSRQLFCPRFRCSTWNFEREWMVNVRSEFHSRTQDSWKNTHIHFKVRVKYSLKLGNTPSKRLMAGGKANVEFDVLILNPVSDTYLMWTEKRICRTFLRKKTMVSFEINVLDCFLTSQKLFYHTTENWKKLGHIISVVFQIQSNADYLT